MVSPNQPVDAESDASDIEFRIFDPGDTYEEDTRASKRANEGLRTVVERFGGQLEIENHGVQAGDHVTYLASVATLATSAVYLAKEVVLPLARVVAEYLQELRKLRGDGAGDRVALQLVAYARIQDLDPEFVPMMKLDRCLEDGASRYAALASSEGDCEGFAVGNHVFSIVDHRRWTTHIIAMTPQGALLVHATYDGVPKDAEHALLEMGLERPEQPRKTKRKKASSSPGTKSGRTKREGTRRTRTGSSMSAK